MVIDASVVTSVVMGGVGLLEAAVVVGFVEAAVVMGFVEAAVVVVGFVMTVVPFVFGVVSVEVVKQK